MAGRRLGPEERALWRRVTAGVRPIDGQQAVTDGADPAATVVVPLPTPTASTPAHRRYVVQPAAKPPANTLDGTWDRRLRHGLAAPDMTIDLHGYSLAGAHRALDEALARAIGGDARLLLLVTGRPPRADALGERPRGAIRAAIGDWLGASPYAARIAAVRNAHPRHGGAGALYVVLRRRA